MMGLFDFIPNYRDVIPKDSILDVLAETAKMASEIGMAREIIELLMDDEDEDE